MNRIIIKNPKRKKIEEQQPKKSSNEAEANDDKARGSGARSCSEYSKKHY
jgi:hypothetical protein